MPQLINFDSYKPDNTNRREIAISPSTVSYSVQNSDSEVDYAYKLTLDLLTQNNPNKIIFSIKDAAEVLGVGTEFIRRRIKSGRIKVTYLGDKPFINIAELARISIEGV
jgi:excisionase family DNA binding protein